MSRARDFADLAGAADAGGLTGRNLIINGAMLVSQRGTSFTSVADNAYTLDRYRLTENTSAVVDMSQSSEVPSEGGFSSSLKIDVTTAATPSGGQAFCLNYRMEGYDFLPSDYGNSNAKYVTLSFWVKSNVTGTYRLTFIARNGSGNRSIGATYTINSADTWEKKEVSIIPDTASTPYQTTDEGFRIEWYLASGPDRTTGSLPTSWATLDNATRATGQGVNLASSTSNEWYITGIQLEVGEQATPFEHEPYAVTLQKAKRYYEQHNFDTTTSMYGGAQSGSRGECPFVYDVPKRANPTISVNDRRAFRVNDWRGGDEQCSAFTALETRPRQARLGFDKTTSNLTTGYVIYMNREGAFGTDPILYIDAEL